MERSIRMAKDFLGVFICLFVFLAMGCIVQAEENANTAVIAEKQQPEAEMLAAYNRGMAYMEAGKESNAIAEFMKIEMGSSLYQDAQTQIIVAQGKYEKRVLAEIDCFVVEGKFEKAKTLLEMSSDMLDELTLYLKQNEIDEAWIEAYADQAKKLAEQKRFSEAAAEIELGLQELSDVTGAEKELASIGREIEGMQRNDMLVQSIEESLALAELGQYESPMNVLAGISGHPEYSLDVQEKMRDTWLAIEDLMEKECVRRVEQLTAAGQLSGALDIINEYVEAIASYRQMLSYEDQKEIENRAPNPNDRAIDQTHMQVQTAYREDVIKVVNEAVEAQNYPDAIANLQKAVQKMPGDEELMQLLTKTEQIYREYVFAESEALVEEDEFAQALGLLKAYGNAVGTNDDMLRRIAEIETEKILHAAQSSAQNGDLPGAILTLQQAIAGGVSDGKMIGQVNTLEEQYREQVKAQAEALNKTQGFEAALAQIREALTVMPGDAKLTELIDAYKAYAPVYLAEMETFQESSMQIIKNIKDNVGNTYYYAHKAVYDNGNGWMEYKLDGKYNVVEGTAFLSYKSRSTKSETIMKIYGDGILLYTSPIITGGVEPVTIKVDIRGVDKLRIESSGGYIWFGNARVSSGDPLETTVGQSPSQTKGTVTASGYNRVYKTTGFSPFEMVIDVDSLGKIVSVSILDHNETPGFGAAVIEDQEVFDALIGQSIATARIDIVSGATLTSNGINDALNQAEVRYAQAAGE